MEQGTGLARSQEGFILLNWNNLPPPLNDNFANAQGITGACGNVTGGRNTVASKEGGEPNHAANPGGVSVWYQWTAPSSGNFTFNTFGSDFNTLLAVYTGSELSTLTPVSRTTMRVESTQSRVTFNAVAGTVYHIAMDGSAGVPGNVTAFSGNVVLSWFPETGVSNDNFLAGPTTQRSFRQFGRYQRRRHERNWRTKPCERSRRTLSLVFMDSAVQWSSAVHHSRK